MRSSATSFLKVVTTRALILRRYDYGETSQIAHLFGVEEGRVSVLAKGIKKPNPQLKGPFDLFQWADVTYRRREGSDLALLTKFEPITGFRGLRRRLDRFYAGAYFCELLYEFTRELDPQPELLRHAVTGLRQLASAPLRRTPSILLAAELGILDLTGFSPALEHCALCQGPLETGPSVFFARGGGFVCGECPFPGGRGAPCRAGSRAALLTLRREGLENARRFQLLPEQVAELRGVFRELMREILEKPVRSEPYVTDVRYGFPRGSRFPKVTAR